MRYIMKRFVHNILGTVYEIFLGEREEISLDEHNAGECRIYAKQIKVCTAKEDCDEKELRVKVEEITAHEIFHAYVNEAGLDLDENVEELLASFFMKNWKKMYASILTVLEKADLTD